MDENVQVFAAQVHLEKLLLFFNWPDSITKCYHWKVEMLEKKFIHTNVIKL